MIRTRSLTITEHEAPKSLKRRSPETSLICSEAGERVGTCKEIRKLDMSSCESFVKRDDVEDYGRLLTLYDRKPWVEKKS